MSNSVIAIESRNLIWRQVFIGGEQGGNPPENGFWSQIRPQLWDLICSDLEENSMMNIISKSIQQ